MKSEIKDEIRVKLYTLELDDNDSLFTCCFILWEQNCGEILIDKDDDSFVFSIEKLLKLKMRIIMLVR